MLFRSALGAIAVGGGLGAFAYQCFTRILPGVNKIDIASPQLWAIVAGFAIMCVLNVYGHKSKAKWVAQFGMTIAMIGGMLVGACFM